MVFIPIPLGSDWLIGEVGLAFLVVAIAGIFSTSRASRSMNTIIYSNPKLAPRSSNRSLAVEVVPGHGMLSISRHKYSWERYRRLAKKVISEGKHPDEWIKDSLANPSSRRRAIPLILLSQ